jgi:hypothetical protein
MARDRRLRQLENLNQVADTQLPTLHEAQDSEPNRVREGPKHEIDLCLRREGHIRLCELHQNGGSRSIPDKRAREMFPPGGGPVLSTPQRRLLNHDIPPEPRHLRGADRISSPVPVFRFTCTKACR